MTMDKGISKAMSPILRSCLAMAPLPAPSKSASQDTQMCKEMKIVFLPYSINKLAIEGAY